MSGIVRAGHAPKPVGAYPHARRVGNLLFLSGVGPRDAATNAIIGNVYDGQGRLLSYDIEAQCRAVFANVRNILQASGARWEDLIDVTVFLTDMAHDFATYNRVYAEHLHDRAAVPHDARHHGTADTDRNRAEMHRSARRRHRRVRKENFERG